MTMLIHHFMNSFLNIVLYNYYNGYDYCYMHITFSVCFFIYGDKMIRKRIMSKKKIIDRIENRK